MQVRACLDVRDRDIGDADDVYVQSPRYRLPNLLFGLHNVDVVDVVVVVVVVVVCCLLFVVACRFD